MKWTRIETETDHPVEDTDCLVHILDADIEYIESAQYVYDLGAWMIRGEYVSERDYTIIGWADASVMPDYEDVPPPHPMKVVLPTRRLK